MQTQRHITGTLWLVSFIVILAIGLAACGQGQITTSGMNSATAPQSTQPQSQRGLNINLNSYRLNVNTPSQMCTGLLVADVTVSGFGAGHWNTATGAKPANLTIQMVLQNGYRIQTPLRVASMKIFIDHRSKATQEFLFIGGQAGPDRMSIEDYPQVTAGRYLMLFTPTMMVGQKGFDSSRLTLYSAFPIDAQNIVLLQPRIVEQGKVSQQEVKMPLAQVAKQLAACH